MKGVICPKCGFDGSMVVDTRPVGDGIRRRRECSKCLERYTTYEFTDDMVRRIKDRAVKIGLEEGRKKHGKQPLSAGKR